MTAAMQVGAFFDLDGTVIPKPSLESRFFAFLVSRGQIGGRCISGWLAHFAKNICRNPRLAIQANRRYLARLSVSYVADWAVSLTPESLEISPQALARISWHLARQHRVFIVSGTLAPLARVFARRVSSVIGVAGTELQITRGRWTGALASEHLRGAAKRRAVEALAAKHDLRLDHSYAYGNAMGDFAMLDCVAHPHAVNPTAWLRRLALKRNWPISRWESAHPSPDNTRFTIAGEPS